MTMSEKFEKLDSVTALKRAGKKVAEWAKSEFPMSVEDAEVLAYFEDGVGNVGIRLYGKLMREYFTDVLNKMKREGLKECEAVVALEDDGFVTFYGVGPFVAKEAKVEKVREAVRGLILSGKTKVTVSEVHDVLPMLWVKTTEKDPEIRKHDLNTSAWIVERAIKKFARMKFAEGKAGRNAYWLYLK